MTAPILTASAVTAPTVIGPTVAGPAMTVPDASVIVVGLACAAAYAALVLLILLQARRSRTGLLLATASGATALWGLASAMPAMLAPVAGGLDLVHLLAWYGFCLHLYRQARASAAAWVFAVVGWFAIAAVAATALVAPAGLAGPLDLLAPPILLRLGLAIGQLLLLENYWRSHAADRRPPIGLACIALGALAAYDIMVCADAVLMRAAAPTLVIGRVLVAALVTPLLALAAARNRAWQVDIHVSRAAAFHTATLIVSGVFLLALAAAGEMARRFGTAFSLGWGSLAELCVVFAGLVTVAMLLTSAGARGALRRGLVDHFFTHRYDYRREWQRCIDTLIAPGPAALQERVIRALADAVDSPAGLLFMREHAPAAFAPEGPLGWAGAWNAMPLATLPINDDALGELLRADLPWQLPPAAPPAANAPAPDAPAFDVWLAVPLRDPDPGPRAAMGVVLLARPRTPFRIDAEVLALLRILSHEVGIHLAQQRATAALLQTRDLRAFGERFAFVAHDIKNVASQLSLLLSNAETHLANPDFQQDMLATVRASASRIGGLIRRLQPGREAGAPALLDPAPLLAGLTADGAPGGAAASLRLDIDPAAAAARVLIEEAALQAAVIHLLDNAVRACGRAGSVRVSLRATAARVVIDIADDGPGMTAEFIRDQLFRPFASRTDGGTGLGAYQARELVRAAGGDLAVISHPGLGTTMRILLPRADADAGGDAPAVPPSRRLLPAGA